MRVNFLPDNQQTMNTASRMESTGLPGRVQISQATADELAKSGKSAWYTPREEQVVAKGKGHLSTYWLKVVTSVSGGSASSSEHGATESSASGLFETPEENRDDKTSRMTTWAVDMMKKLLIDIEARRESYRRAGVTSEPCVRSVASSLSEPSEQARTVLDEVVEIIRLPNYARGAYVDKSTIVLEDKVTHQLEEFVRAIAAMYKNNAFHSFEHAMHVSIFVRHVQYCT